MVRVPTDDAPLRDEDKDLGFGTKAALQARRLVNRDGSFNVVRRGLSFRQSFSIYHALLTMSWWRFNALVVAAYLVINATFAVFYLAAGLEQMNGVTATTPLTRFAEAFFFSTQTFTTVGYGRISPVGFTASSIAALESMTGLMGFALATGVLYGRFSRPNARILFSEKAVIAPYRGIRAFEFRIANVRANQLIEAEVQVVLSRFEIDAAGARLRKFYPLDLERKTVTFFTLSWTVVHPIGETSPLLHVTRDDLERTDAEFLILFKGFDDTFSQTVHTRSSYKWQEVVFDARFSPILGETPDGMSTIDLDRLDAIETASTVHAT